MTTFYDPDLTAKDLVQSRFGEIQSYGSAAITTANNFIDSLKQSFSGLTASMPSADIDYDFQEIVLDSDIESHRPNAPVDSALTPSVGTIPTIPVLNDITLATLPSVPSFEGVLPEITFPDYPDTDLPASPGDAPSLESIDVPTAPSITLPIPPTVDQILIPSPPDITMPQFDGVLPTEDLTPPEPMFIYNETPYQSDLLDAVTAKLLDDVQAGGTGLDVSVEEAIFDRAVARREIDDERMYDEAENFFAAKGFILPPGALAGRISETLAEISRRNDDINEKVMIEQARLTQTNLHFFIQSSAAMEQQLMIHSNTVADRQFLAAKEVVEAAVKIYNIKIVGYNVRLDKYKTMAAVFESKIRAAASELNLYRTQLEGAKISAEVQGHYVAVYNAQVNAATSLLNMYKTQMEGASVRASLERLKIENFKTEIEAYSANLAAKTAGYNLYQARIVGEASKVDIYNNQVKAFVGQVEAKKIESSMLIAEMEAQIKENDSKVNSYLAEVEGYKTNVLKENSRIEALVKTYGYKVGAYEADTAVAKVELDAQIKTYDSKIQQAKNQTDLLLGEAKLNIERYLGAQAIFADAIKSGANVSAQLAASSMGAVNASASIGYNANQGTQASSSYNQQVSSSTSTSHVTQEIDSVSTTQSHAVHEYIGG